MRGTGFAIRGACVDNNVGWNAMHLVGLKVSHQLMNRRCRELHIISATRAATPAIAVEAGIVAIETHTAVGGVGALVFSDRC